MATFTLIADPGHGWLKVTVNDIYKVGLKPTDFSRYSYRSGRNCYLEEDCDAPKFVDAWTATFGPNVACIIETKTVDRTGIRRMGSINPVGQTNAHL
jgi:hypothetical protein